MSYTHTTEYYPDEEHPHRLTIEIVSDDDPISPYEWDSAGKIVSFSKYVKGDENPKDYYDWMLELVWDILSEKQDYVFVPTLEGGGKERLHVDDLVSSYNYYLHNRQVMEWAQEIVEREYVVVPIYAYVHGGVTVSSSSFSCPWDSGQAGLAMISREEIFHEWGGKNKKVLTAQLKERARNYLKARIETLDDYYTGNVWGYVIENEDGDDEGSCWGFYGDPDYCLEEAMSIAKHIFEKAEAERERVRIEEEHYENSHCEHCKAEWDAIRKNEVTGYTVDMYFHKHHEGLYFEAKMVEEDDDVYFECPFCWDETKVNFRKLEAAIAYKQEQEKEVTA